MKEYNNDNNNDNILIFEWEYLKGKRWNGRIKEYNDDIMLIFEGGY